MRCSCACMEGSWDRQRNIDLAFKKLDLRNLTKSATSAEEKMENMVETETGMVEEPCC